MPKLVEPKKNIPFTPVKDPAYVTADPINGRVLALFDALRRRNVGPERAAFAISQVYSNHDAGCAPQARKGSR
jgi:hypothetical protein